jgi:outer membrane usher protein
MTGASLTVLAAAQTAHAMSAPGDEGDGLDRPLVLYPDPPARAAAGPTPTSAPVVAVAPSAALTASSAPASPARLPATAPAAFAAPGAAARSPPQDTNGLDRPFALYPEAVARAAPLVSQPVARAVSATPLPPSAAATPRRRWASAHRARSAGRVTGVALGAAVAAPSDLSTAASDAAGAGVDAASRPQAPPPPPAPGATPAPETQPEIRNPFGHDIELTMALTYNKRDIGELPVTLTKDNRVLVHTQDFTELVAPLLNPAGRKEVAALLGTGQAFAPDQLHAAGISLIFDPAALAVVILKIDPDVQSSQLLYANSTSGAEPGFAPARFAAYINTNAGLYWSSASGSQPYVNLQGVIHYDHWVIESDFIGQDLATPNAPNAGFDFQREYVRLVYDDPDRYLRFYAGDLTTQLRDGQNQLDIAGVGVVRQRQIFDPSRLASLSGNQQFVLQNAATVDILRNGQLIQQLSLTPGSYNLNNLPLVGGSNNLQIQVHEIGGQSQTLNYSTYLDPIDLSPGDYEYAAYVGALSATEFNQPEYKKDVAFSGYYRRAFTNATAAGVGLQADDIAQMIDGEYRVLLPLGARLELAAGLSHVKYAGEGATFSAEYDLSFNRGGGLYDSLNARVRYNSPHFETVGEDQPNNPEVGELSASYTHAFNRDFQTSLNGYYALDRYTGKWAASAYVDNAWRFNRNWMLHFGAGYQETVSVNGDQRGLGAELSLTWRPSVNYDVQTAYDGVNNTESLTATKEGDTYVNDYGYTLQIENDGGSPSLSGEANYIGDRFTIDAQGGSTGDSFSHIGQSPSASVILGASIGYVDGHIGIGRPITDSFMVAYANPNLDHRPVILGDDLQEGHYDAASGILGAALYGNLPSYSNDVIHYDVLDPPVGYDVGPGVETVRPLYRSGYALEVGSDAFISAVGTLIGIDGKPLSLASGHITALDDPKAHVDPFFTNSVGRFAIQSLKPGSRYRVDLNTAQSVSFTFETPRKGEALIDLRTVKVDTTAD